MSAPTRTGRGRPAADARRRGAVYGILCVAVDRRGMPIPGEIVLGYVGQTRQTVKQREGQHRDGQPFGDLIVGGSFTVEEGVWTDAELDAREEYYIRNGVAIAPGGPIMRPVYNFVHNQDNPGRIEVWRAREQRQAREPGWVPLKERHRPVDARPGRGPVRVRPGGRSRRRGRRWTRDRVRVAVWVGVWVVLVGVSAVWVASRPGLVWSDGVWVGVGLGSVVVGWWLPGDPGWPFRRRRRRR